MTLRTALPELQRPPARLIHTSESHTATFTRPATRHDWPLVDALQRRCSVDTVYETFGLLRMSPVQWHEQASRRRSLPLITAPRGQYRHLIALTAVHSVAGEPTAASLQIMVQDTWHRQGIGTQLARYAAQLTRDAGYRTLVARFSADNTAMAKVVRALGAMPASSAGPHITVRLPLEGAR